MIVAKKMLTLFAQKFEVVWKAVIHENPHRIPIKDTITLYSTSLMYQGFGNVFHDRHTVSREFSSRTISEYANWSAHGQAGRTKKTVRRDAMVVSILDKCLMDLAN